MRRGPDQPLHEYDWRNGTIIVWITTPIIIFLILLYIWMSHTANSLNMEIDPAVKWGLFGIVAVLIFIDASGFSQRRSAIIHREQAELSDKLHEWEKENMDLSKASKARHELAHELEMEIQKEVYRENQRKFTRWRVLVASADRALASINAAQIELRNNPRYDEIMAQYLDLYKLIQDFDPDTEIDQEGLREGLENVLTVTFTRQTGVNPNGPTTRTQP